MDFFSRLPSGGDTLETKNIALSDIPSVETIEGSSCKADDAFIFRTGMVDYRCVPGLSTADVPTMKLFVISPGYKTQSAETSLKGYAHNSTKQVAKGCTFAIDSQDIDKAELIVRLCLAEQTLLERSVDIKTLRYTGQTFFTNTLHFGGLQGKEKNNLPIATITMAFELLSQGDGKFYKRKEPRFADIDVAKLVEGTDVPQSMPRSEHPLAQAAASFEYFTRTPSLGEALPMSSVNTASFPGLQQLQGSLCPADATFIFRAGVVDYRCVPGLSDGVAPLINFLLKTPGYTPQMGQTMTTGYAHNSTHTVAQGCTFAFDSRLLEDTELVVQVCSDNKVLLERTVAVKSLTYTQQTFFTSTLHFGGVRGTDKNSTAIPTITMAYELLAQGDGKYFQRSNPRFDDVTVAVPYQGPGTSSAPAANPLVPVMAVMTVS